MILLSKRSVFRVFVTIRKSITRLSIIIGLLYSFVQYERIKLDGEVKQTLLFYDKFNSSPFTGYRENLTDIVSKNIEEIKASLRSDESFSIQIEKIIKLGDSRKSFDMVLDFFDGVAVCMETDICDKVTAKQLFQSRASELYEIFYPYIKKNRVENKSDEYAGGLEYVTKYRGNVGFLKTIFRNIILF
jgi:hypothetical protein